MKKQFIAFLLAGTSVVALAQTPNPFKPAPAPSPASATGAGSPVGSGPTMAALGGVPQGPGGVPVGPDGRPYPQANQGLAGQQVGAVPPPVPSNGMPAALEKPAEAKPEVRVRFVGKVNGQNLYKAEGQYHFDKKKRPSVELVEDRSVASPSMAASSAGPKPTPSR